ncbi:hypothetical protein FHL15_000215 [Xylaria flabelliformis]|uniref:BZIP domain-containing protein n=1 Tax=Xylaria flabelliformis TaxID=2512241 RepID=A0A553IF95_9PEZI|nr:hypothetical protein FHL15_000215 [Xylaria flabelliformis]
MPRKVRPPADAAQNRENQQRSRARRREYLASLEARVRDFESREIQATQAMQRAAQEVAWVNERLMELLAAKGVAREEVDEFLRRAGKEADARDVEQGSQARRASFRVEDVGACQGVENRKDSNHGGDIADTGIGISTTVDEHRMNVSLSKPSVDEGPSAHVTSCDDAAGIIAGFHGHGDVSHARNVLGCGDAAKCHVKNTRLFQLMDEAGCP